VFTALIEPLIFKERLKKVDGILALGVFAGIIIMTPRLDLTDSTTVGILFGTVSGLFFMVRNLITRKYVRKYPASTLMFWQMVVAGISLVPWVTIRGASYTGKTWMLLILLGTLFTALPQSLFSAGLRNLSARTVGVFNTLLVVYGALFGYLIHGERIHLRTALGGIVILGCVIAETLRRGRS